ncbi:MAG: AMP-binding protein, partial [Chloroflexota bacterium]
MGEQPLSQSYVHGTSETALIGRTIGDLFDHIAHDHGDHDALVDRGQGLRYSYTALRTTVNGAARAFHALGLRKGDRLGIWAPNRAE